MSEYVVFILLGLIFVCTIYITTGIQNWFRSVKKTIELILIHLEHISGLNEDDE